MGRIRAYRNISRESTFAILGKNFEILLSQFANIHSLRTLLALLDMKGYPVPIIDASVTNDGGDVEKDISTTVLLDKPVSFPRVEPLNRALRHS